LKKSLERTPRSKIGTTRKGTKKGQKTVKERKHKKKRTTPGPIPSMGKFATPETLKVGSPLTPKEKGKTQHRGKKRG